jgi:flagellar operon protein (TIGR03826 family)
MELRKCPRCGNLFAYVAIPICDKCLQKEEDDFIKVRDYLRENPMSGLKETSKDTNVSEDLILHFLKEGRIVATTAFGEILTCERCGKPINSGRFCEKCIMELRTGFYRPHESGADHYKPSGDPAEMRFQRKK